MLKEFRQFVLRGNVVDLAVGVVIGAAFGAIINAFVSGMINPTIAIFGDAGLKELGIKVGSKVVENKDVAIELQYGLVLDAIVNFLLIAAFVFFFVVKPVNHLMERFKADAPIEVPTRECPECLSKIPRPARRCAYCTAPVAAG